MHPLHVVTCVSNPVRYASRSRLYGPFARHVRDSGAILWTAELAFGSRPFVVTEEGNPYHLRYRSSHELWHKENLLNLAISRLPSDWRYVAWVDADVTFARPDWAVETVHQLQHHPVVQLFSAAIDLCPRYGPLKTHTGFVAAYQAGHRTTSRPYEGFHPGFAWAARREAIDQLGGLFDTAILGSADRHMATALLTDVRRSYPSGISPGYRAALTAWQRRALSLRQDVGHVPGTLLHHWHGRKSQRGYADRWKILVDTQYDPETDLKRDWQGVWQLTERSTALRDGIRGYFRSRNEDSIDPE